MIRTKMLKILPVLIFYLAWANCDNYVKTKTTHAATKGGHDAQQVENLEQQSQPGPIRLQVELNEGSQSQHSKDRQDQSQIRLEDQSVTASQFSRDPPIQRDYVIPPEYKSPPFPLPQNQVSPAIPYSLNQNERQIYKSPEFQPPIEKEHVKAESTQGCVEVPLVRLGNKKYYLNQFYQANYFEATRLCNEHGMKLGTIHSKEDEFALMTHLKDTDDKRNYMMSATDLGEHGKFVWLSSGKPVHEIDWKHEEVSDGADDKHCLNINHPGTSSGGGWNKCSCADKHHFICELNPEPSPEDACETCRKYHLSLREYRRPDYNRPPYYPSRPTYPYHPSVPLPYPGFHNSINGQRHPNVLSAGPYGPNPPTTIPNNPFRDHNPKVTLEPSLPDSKPSLTSSNDPQQNVINTDHRPHSNYQHEPHKSPYHSSPYIRF